MINQNALIEVLHEVALQLSSDLKSALGSFSWPERIANVENKDNKWIISFFSDGLNLSQKSAVESAIKNALKSKPDVGQWLVYFTKKEKTAAAAPQQDRKGGAEAHNHQHSHAPSSAPNKTVSQKKAIPGVRHVIAVASGKGGVGKSTVSVNLAVALQNQGYDVGILDADIYGPSLPMMLGVKAEPKVNEKNKIIPPEGHGLKVMSFGFFAPPESAIVWRGPMIMKALQQFFYDVDWGELDFLIIDLPPGTGDAQLTLVQSLPIAGSVVVTTPQNVALLDAVKGVVMFQKCEVPVLGIVENMATFECPHCNKETEIFGHGGAHMMSDRYKIPILGQIPLKPELRAAGDEGVPVTTQPGNDLRMKFAAIAERVVANLS